MKILSVKGGKSLLGEVEISGSKNSALKLIIASLFSHEEITLSNIPKIKSIETELKILESLGSRIEYLNDNYLKSY